MELVRHLVDSKPRTLGVGFAFVTVLVASLMFAPHALGALADFHTHREAIVNCKDFTLDDGEEAQTLVDSENAILYVKSHKSDDTVTVITLPYKPGNSKALGACSDDAKHLVAHATEAHEALMKDTCAHFRDIVESRKPLDERNGKKGNMKGATNFVQKHCQ